MIKKWDKSTFLQISGVFGTRTFTAKEFSESNTVLRLNSHIFRIQLLQKYLTPVAYLFSVHWKFNVDIKN